MRPWSAFRRRIVEAGPSKEGARFAAYAVVLNQDDPYAKAIQTLVDHSRELEQSVAALQGKLAELERELARHEAESAQTEALRVVK